MNENRNNQAEETSKGIAKQQAILRKQQELLNFLLWGLVCSEPAAPLKPTKAQISDNMSTVLIAMLLGALISCESLITLSKGPGTLIRDCYTIARTIIESFINLSFILAEGESAAEKAIRHCNQKAYRDLDRTSRVADFVISLKYQGMPSLREIPGMDEMIDEFTSSSGREKSWIDFSIDQRIEKIGEVFGDEPMLLMHAARFGIYRHASEIMHGTMFGTVYFLGTTDPGRASRSIGESINSVYQKLMFIFLCVQFACYAFIKCIDSRYGFPEIEKQSHILLKNMIDVFLKRNQLEK